MARNQPNDLQHAKQVLIKLRACPEEEAEEEVRSMREEMSNDGVNVEKRCAWAPLRCSRGCAPPPRHASNVT